MTFVSREAAPGSLAGRIPAAIRDGRLEKAAGVHWTHDSHVMLCGNPDMLKDAQAALGERGLRKHRRRNPGPYHRGELLVAIAKNPSRSVLAALLASGCSTLRFAYENADTYLRWKAGTYVDLQGDEADELDDRIDEFHAWHRKHALPKYVTAGAGGVAALRRRAVARRPRLGVRCPEGAGAREPAQGGGAARRRCSTG